MPLVLKRKERETIIVDGPAVIEIAAINGRYVSVAVTAPETTRILRGELTDGKDAKALDRE
jgi:carbon storage regulator CsrA